MPDENISFDPTSEETKVVLQKFKDTLVSAITKIEALEISNISKPLSPETFEAVRTTTSEVEFGARNLRFAINQRFKEYWDLPNP
jgi:hypothetical protein